MNPVPQSGSILTVEVDRLSFPEGFGVARCDGFVIFIAEAAPGDRLQVRVTEAHARYARAEIVDILVASPFRRKPPCPHFGPCGGCTWQHISDEAQIIEKRQFLDRFLLELAKTGQVSKSIALDLIASPRPLRYRNRIQLHQSQGQIGYFGRGSSTIVPIQDCLLAEEEISAELQRIRSAADSDREDRLGSKFEIAHLQNGRVEVRKLDQAPTGSLFSQVNRHLNSALVEFTLAAAQALKAHRVLDLYSGQGNFGVALAQRLPGTKVTLVELSHRNHALCVEKLTELRLTNASAHCSDVAVFLKRFKTNLDFDFVIVDPPRPGLSKAALKQLIALKPRSIVYVSCNPATLTRDLKILMKEARYGLIDLKGFDLFPQTPHLEVVAILKIAADGVLC